MPGRRKERKPISVEAMRLRLAGLCARSEQCESDLRQKIYRAGLTSGQSDEIISFLKENRYLDESRYAKAYCNDKVRFSGWGKIKIREGLRAKRISSGIIEEALGNIDHKEYVDKLKQTGIAKARRLNMLDYADKAKFLRQMTSRGYETSLVTKLADAIIKKLTDEK